MARARKIKHTHTRAFSWFWFGHSHGPTTSSGHLPRFSDVVLDRDYLPRGDDHLFEIDSDDRRLVRCTRPEVGRRKSWDRNCPRRRSPPRQTPSVHHLDARAATTAIATVAKCTLPFAAFRQEVWQDVCLQFAKGGPQQPFVMFAVDWRQNISNFGTIANLIHTVL